MKVLKAGSRRTVPSGRGSDSDGDATGTLPRLSTLALAGVAGLAAVWAVASLWFPFGWDQGIHASVGDVIVRGGMPYRDGWDVKGPLTYYVFALAQALFGRHMWGIRILDLLLLAGGAEALRRLVSRRASPAAGVWTALAFVLWYASLTWFYLSQPDGWAALIVAVAVGPLLARDDPPASGRLFIAGFLIGACALLKPFYGAFGAVPAVHALAFRRALGWDGVAGRWLLFAAALLVAPALMAALFVARGAWDELLAVQLRYNLEVYSGLEAFGPVDAVRSLLEYAGTGATALVLPPALLGLWALWRSQRPAAVGLGAWVAVALFCVTIQGKFWTYHWIPLYPPLAALGGIGLWSLAIGLRGSDAERRTGAGGAFAAIATALLLLQVAPYPARDVVRWAGLVSGRNPPGTYYRGFAEWRYV
ncbi:MAG: ArnT family glycosyltransferase, partial [Gemmatimonadota bacterium]